MMTAVGVRSRRLLRDLLLHNPIAGILRLLLQTVAAARCRARIRHDLRRLARADDHILRDIGLTRMTVARLAAARRPR